ncbi:hypothetical protein DICVIV_14334 [Dictyocaulus viviparus]|uniref:Uncharacterized protein n=1 Tax=Dictyocaulus viviparus TaxID=29172 RepID=A0A0D8X5M6_DICVI|nr:hypothetical protein DICVIV_14334 [Dictyocaulus viviparus]
MILDGPAVPISVRQSALDTILHLTRSDDLCDYAPRLMQTWQRCGSTLKCCVSSQCCLKS